MGQMNELGGDQTSQSMSSMLEFTARCFGGFAFAHPITQYDPNTVAGARRAVMAAAKPAGRQLVYVRL